MASPFPVSVTYQVVTNARDPAADLVAAHAGKLTLIRLARCWDQRPARGAEAHPCEWCDTLCWILPATLAMRSASTIPTVAICTSCVEHAFQTPPSARS